ncbi:MAG: L-methionine (R)-S-oxide reductase [Pseudoalteromonas tetraodonis]|jgi:L-methionine (R)-S-oxide reductase
MDSTSQLTKSVSDLLSDTGRDALPAVLEKILTHFDCVTGTVHLLGDDGMLDLLAQRGIPESILPMVSKIPVGKGMAGLAAERRKPVQVCNLQTDDSGDVRPGAKDTKMEGSVAAPMFDESGELIGTLGVAKPQAYDFTDDETALLEQLGKTIAANL